VQELAYTLADGIEYVRAARKTGLTVDQFAPRLSFFFGIGMNFFMEIAKLRAARRLWAELMRRHFDPKDERSLLLRTHCQTSGVSLTSQDPYNNVVRTALEALAAVLGGTQSLHTNSFDEALALPSEASARIARNTQLILREETGVTRVVDPLGGSYYVEALTDTLIQEATKLIDEVEALGGMTRAVENGLPKRRVEESAARRQARVDRAEEIVVGVNRYRPEREELVDVLTVDNAAVRASQVARLARVRAARDEGACRAALAAIKAAAERDEPLMPLAIAAARARATVGEISDALEAVYGRHRADASIAGGIYGAGWGEEGEFADLRAAVAAFARSEGRRPRLLVAKIGQDGHDRGSKVVASAFADAGYDVDIGPLFATPEEVVRQAIENDVHAVGISTLAGGHLTLVPAVIEGLRAAGAGQMLMVVGGVVPPQDYAALEAAGVGAVFGPGTRIPEAARKVLELLTPDH
jgi:methylmalonyl-CoA mutase